LPIAVITGIVIGVMEATKSFPTRGGTIVTREIGRDLTRAQLPQEREFTIDSHAGVRGAPLNLAATPEIQAVYAGLGFQKYGPLLAYQINKETASARGTEAVAGFDPRVSALATGGALGLAGVMFQTKGDVFAGANILTNNLNLLGVSAGEAKRQL